MARFKITFTDTGVDVVEAQDYSEYGDWIDFEDADGVTLTRVRATTVKRIDREG